MKNREKKQQGEKNILKRVMLMAFIFSASAVISDEKGRNIGFLLGKYFPEGYSKRTLIITEKEETELEKAAKAKLSSRILTLFQGKNGGYAVVGKAMIRTHGIVFLGVFDSEGSIKSVDITAFREPEDYYPPASWLALLEGKRFPLQLFPGSSLPNITGATLTARTIARELRKMLALIHSVRKGEIR